MKAIRIATFGKPAETAQCVDMSDVGAPCPDEVVIEVEASPINQYDLLMIAGGVRLSAAVAGHSRHRRSRPCYSGRHQRHSI
jgi:NADPH:quinone reductase-like Zn-dependent oxidoreductase